MTESLRDRHIRHVSGHRWFHSIDFGSFASSGRFRPGQPQNITLYGAFELLTKFDLSEARLLDIGAYDGVVSFGAAALNAKHVVAIDTFDHATFRLAREILGMESAVAYEPARQIQDLTQTFDAKSFDIIVCAGVVYHMLHPMQAFTECRKVLADDGYLILETPYDAERDDAVLVFNGVEQAVNEPYTYFVPTLSALKGMATLAGFAVIAERELLAPKRTTLLLQATPRPALAEMDSTPPFIRQMLLRDTCDDSFRHTDIEATPRSATPGLLDITRVDRFRLVDASHESVAWPAHPPPDRPAFGETRFEQADGNTIVL